MTSNPPPLPDPDQTLPSRELLRIFGRPVSRLMALTLGLALLLLGLLSVQLYQAAWDEAWRDVHEKHRVLALNLAVPVAAYVNDRRRHLALLADELRANDVPDQAVPYAQGILMSAFPRNVSGVRSVSLLRADGRLLFTSQARPPGPAVRRALTDSQAFFDTLVKRTDSLSGVAASPFDGKPVVMLGQPVRGRDGAVAAVLLAELSPKPIEELRRQVRFGRGGHAAIVDQNGRVLAHPSTLWMAEMRDLSELSVVQAMMAGRTGVMSFYSPFVKGDMVAGYTAIPGLGWGVMVPQPKQEILQRVRNQLWRQLLWGLLGLMVVAGLTYGAVVLMTGPLQRMMERD